MINKTDSKIYNQEVGELTTKLLLLFLNVKDKTFILIRELLELLEKQFFRNKEAIRADIKSMSEQQ